MKGGDNVKTQRGWSNY